jgi:hypothetical protein
MRIIARVEWIEEEAAGSSVLLAGLRAAVVPDREDRLHMP